jgi:hypothetical protein
MDLTEKQWKRLEPIILQSVLCKKDTRGRKPHDPREVPERDFMGAAHRRAVEGFARPIPVAPDLPQTIPALDDGWGILAYYRGTGGRLAGARPN